MLESEDDLAKEGDKRYQIRKDKDKSKPSFPSAGQIVFKNVSMRYRPGMDLALKGLSFTA